VDPLFDSPATDLRLRDRLVEIRDRRGAEHLHQMLARVDVESARRINVRDWSRTMRALEYYFQTRMRLSEVRHESNSIPEFARRVRVIVLDPPRATLYERINRRADQMFNHGLVEEVESLIASGVPHNAKAFGAHGYRRVIEYLQGKRTREDALNQMKLDTRHYAKRQLTWWRAWSAKGRQDAVDDGQSLKWIYRFGEEGEALAEALEYLGSRI
jgi:tRNA dimethylallyltransferase